MDNLDKYYEELKKIEEHVMAGLTDEEKEQFKRFLKFMQLYENKKELEKAAYRNIFH